MVKKLPTITQQHADEVGKYYMNKSKYKLWSTKKKKEKKKQSNKNVWYVNFRSEKKKINNTFLFDQKK